MDTTIEQAEAGTPPPSSGPPGVLSRKYIGLTIGVFATVFLVAFEAIAVATAMPVVVRELDGLPVYAWAFAGFLVASMFATVLAGNLVDRLGPFRPFVSGVGVFAVGLIVAGTAQGMSFFVLGRMLQGLGAGAILVTLDVVVARAYPEEMRPKAMSMMTAAWVLPAMVGPVVAGSLAEIGAWRWVFLGLIPLVALALSIIVRRVYALPRPSDTAAPSAGRRGLLWLALAAAVGFGLLQYAGQERTLIGLGVAAVGLALVVPSLPRLLPSGTLRFRRGLPMIVLMRGLLMGGLVGIEAFVPLMLVTHRQLSPTVAGLLFTVTTLGWAAGAWLQARPNLRISRPNLVRLGAGLMAAGALTIIATLSVAVPVWLAMVGWTLAGMGSGMSVSTLFVLLFEVSPVEEQGANAGAITLSDSIGQVTAVGIGGILFAGLQTTTSGALLFLPIFGLMALVLLVGFATASRLTAPAAEVAGRT
ncbi:MAG TPA: MFS transporter [Actinopolymorphaceae bacterium]